MEITLRQFDSWYDFAVQCAEGKRVWKAQASQGTRNFDFYRTRTFSEAVDMALRTGWPEGRKLLGDSYAIVSPRPEPHQSQIYSVAGMFPSIPVYIAGSPECMIDLANVEVATNPIIRIDYMNGGNSNISSNSYMLRGAAVLSLCNQLEHRGFSVEIRLVHRSTREKYGKSLAFDTQVVIKKAGQPIDLDRMAFALAHPATQRRLRFALIEQHAELEPYYSHSYGYATTVPPEPRADTIYIPPPSQGETPASARLAVAIAAKAFLESSGDSQGELVTNHEMIW